MLTNYGHKLCSLFTKGSQLQFLLIKRPQFSDDNRGFAIQQNDDLKGHRKITIESNFPVGGRMNKSLEENYHVLGGADSGGDGQGLKFLTQSLDAFEKCYQVVNRMSLEKNDERVEVQKVSYLLGRSQVGLYMIRDLMRDGLTTEEFESSHELYLDNLPKIGISIDGKDVSKLDSPSMRHALWLWHLERLISFGDNFTREKLIALFYLIIHTMWNREPTYSLHYMRLFTNEYSKTKKLYTSILGDSLTNTWSQVLGRIFTENEFDNFNDLDSELPVNLKSMYHIFSAFISFADSESIPVDTYLRALDKEQVNNPLNTYIPFMKVMMEDQFEDIETVLKIMEKSPITNHQANEKRYGKWWTIFE
ncbi:predicted protein [Naegleria gruberi]|uniref:Predicted protein n=1 Tax=Naegleria gruberi TaxID=5762 RepID=D2VW19_NAEGR|nr:uncharacterized protein NAEGRDRAFT_73218 [Naegleria gruberi]EFC38937.1 predicted protein [Naegleria gruberi]|eukprot:XP_002671681.1 predicted protein [Naegleria gruberi strain NEG-M]